MSENSKSASFNKNYKVLKETADWLSQQKEPDIDQLVPKVETAMQAYKVCKARLDAVQATLSQYFQVDDAGFMAESPTRNGDGPPRSSRKGTVAADLADEEDDDAPF